MARRPFSSFGLGLGLSVLAAGLPVRAAGPPVVVEGVPGTNTSVLRRVREVVGSRRAVRDDVPVPPAESVSTERAVMEERATTIRLALRRAQVLESEASWAGCVREAAGALSDAVEVLAKVDDLALLRDLHAQIGSCMTLNQSAPDALPHFLAAAMLDESPIRTGLHREEAERAATLARADVLTRARGLVRIETTPPGARVWIDGREEAGKTPLNADVRLGDHYVTVRRFRFEPHTERTVLQPSGVVRIDLDPARRATLREQLAAVVSGRETRPEDEEMRLARAVWSRAEQLVEVIPGDGGAARVVVRDATTGQTLRDAVLPSSDGDAFRRGVCDALGETCEATSHPVPWYVWPLAGTAVVSAVVATVVLVNHARPYHFCPAAGCN